MPTARNGSRKRPSTARRGGKRNDRQRVSGLVDTLRMEVAGLERTHPHLVDSVNELAVILSRLGI